MSLLNHPFMYEEFIPGKTPPLPVLGSAYYNFFLQDKSLCMTLRFPSFQLSVYCVIYVRILRPAWAAGACAFINQSR